MATATADSGQRRGAGPRGTGLVITVDCGIGSVDEVALARSAGIEVVVSDHHEPLRAPARLPHSASDRLRLPLRRGSAAPASPTSCAHTRSGRPRAPGRGATSTLSPWRRSPTWCPAPARTALLVREGCALARPARGPGLRALMAVPRGDPERLDEGALAFRLGAPDQRGGAPLPGGRRGRADAHRGRRPRRRDRRRARPRQPGAPGAEREVLDAAERARAALPADHPEGPALVLAGEGWHPGVVGIVASRLVERHWPPGDLIAIDVEGPGGVGPQHPRLRPGRRARGVRPHWLASAATGPPPASSWRPARSRPSARPSSAHAPGSIRPTWSGPSSMRWWGSAEGIGHGPGPAARAPRPLRDGQPGPRLLVPSARLREVRPLGRRANALPLLSSERRRPGAGVAFGMNGELRGRETGARPRGRPRGGSLERRRAAPRGAAGALPLEPPRRSRRPAAAARAARPGREWWGRLEPSWRARPGPPGPLLDVRAADGPPGRASWSTAAAGRRSPRSPS